MIRILVTVLLLLSSGCVVHGRGRRAHLHAPAVVLGAGHVHGHDCGHYLWRGHWRHAHSHSHGPGCGHRLHGGFWILAD